MGRISLIVMFILSIVLIGCASNTSGSTAFQNPENMQQLHINKSTKRQVKKLLKEPQSITIRSDQKEIWVYQKSNTSYTEKYAAKTALSFVPIPYLGTAVALADNVIDAGPDKTVDTNTLTLTFDKNGILVELKKETLHS